MRNFTLTVLFFLLLATSAAANLNTTEAFNALDTAGQAAVMKTIAVEEAKASAIPRSVEDVERYVGLVEAVGSGLSSLARELGVTANEILHTPVGYITVGLIAYNVMGEDVMGVFQGVLWLFISLPLWFFWFLKTVIPVYDYKTIKKSTFFRGVVECEVPLRKSINFDGYTKAGNPGSPGAAWISAVWMVLTLIIAVIFIE